MKKSVQESMAIQYTEELRYTKEEIGANINKKMCYTFCICRMIKLTFM